MTQEEIQEEGQKLEAKMNEANAEVQRVALEMQILHTRCLHPDKFETSSMGESYYKCPDCG